MSQFLSNRLTPWIDPRVASVRVPQIQAYLLQRGWKAQPSPRSQVLLFVGPQADDGEPIVQAVPAPERGSDYTQRIVDVITNLALLEDRYAVEILSDILKSGQSEQSPAPVAPEVANPRMTPVTTNR